MGSILVHLDPTTGSRRSGQKTWQNALVACLLVAAGTVLFTFLSVPGGALAHGDRKTASWHPLNPKRVKGAESCAECHKAEHAAWEKSEHATSFEEMHRKEEAQEMAKILGVRRLKTMGLCVECHYTPMEEKGRVRSRHGVSCESCHGAAKEWEPVHDDFGGKDVKPEDETPDHRKWRIRESVKLGMHHPETIFELASQCYGCHVIRNEELMTKTQHPLGDGFELVAWSQGEVRHNYSESDGKENATPPIERLRLFYAMGWALELEYTLRGAASAKQEGTYLEGLRKRIKTALAKLEEIDKALGSQSPVGEILAVGKSAPVKAERRKELLAAAHKIADATRKFVGDGTPKKWGALDPLLPKGHQYKGEAQP